MKASACRKAAITATVLLMSSPGIGLADARSAAGWRHTLTAAYAWQGESDLAGQGGFRVQRGVVQYQASTRIGQRWSAGVSFGYGEDRYRFEQSTGSISPWGDIRSFQFGLPTRYLASSKWTLFALPILRFSAEDNASLGEGREFGLIAGGSYRLSDRLTIGPGLGAFRGFGNEDDLFPVLFIDWRLSATLSLETGRGLAATRGPGLALRWRPREQWTFGLAARYEKSRFRLADGADSIGQDKAVPIIATASWQATRTLQLSAIAGVETSGVLRVEDSDGNLIAEQSYGTVPIAGLIAAFQF